MQLEIKARRKKFRPAVIIRDNMKEDPSHSRKALSKAVKAQVTAEDDKARVRGLCSLPKQGHLMCTCLSNTPAIWARAVQSLSDEQLKFVLNAANDTLPHNANLKLWGKKTTSTCPLCHKDPQNLVHVLNSCEAAKNVCRYDERHDLVLLEPYQVL